MYDVILVPTDGSDGANRAIEHALTLANRHDATIHSLFVVDHRQYGEPALSSVELVVGEVEDHGQTLLDELAERADNEGIKIVTRCCHGIPHEEIAGYADEVDADLIIVGYQGQSHRNRIGSVAERVVRHAGRPVLTA